MQQTSWTVYFHYIAHSHCLVSAGFPVTKTRVSCSVKYISPSINFAQGIDFLFLMLDGKRLLKWRSSGVQRYSIQELSLKQSVPLYIK